MRKRDCARTQARRTKSASVQAPVGRCLRRELPLDPPAAPGPEVEAADPTDAVDQAEGEDYHAGTDQDLEIEEIGLQLGRVSACMEN